MAVHPASARRAPPRMDRISARRRKGSDTLGAVMAASLVPDDSPRRRPPRRSAGGAIRAPEETGAADAHVTVPAVCGSTARAPTSVFGSPALFADQLAPPSVLLKTPLGYDVP